MADFGGAGGAKVLCEKKFRLLTVERSTFSYKPQCGQTNRALGGVNSAQMQYLTLVCAFLRQDPGPGNRFLVTNGEPPASVVEGATSDEI